MKTRCLKNTVLFIALSIVPFLSKAQGEPPEDTVDTPIDSWLVMLIAVGMLYGVYKYWTGKRQSVKETTG